MLETILGYSIALGQIKGYTAIRVCFSRASFTVIINGKTSIVFMLSFSGSQLYLKTMIKTTHFTFGVSTLWVIN